MKASDIYGSKYLGAADLNGKTVDAAIVEVDSEEFEGEHGRMQTKIVIVLEAVPKKLVLNKTNAEVVIDALGDDTDEWLGHSLRLGVAKVDFNGKKVPALRIKEVIRAAG